LDSTPASQENGQSPAEERSKRLVVDSVANRYCARLRLNSPPVSVFVGSYGVFLKPIMADMGWDRGTASFALSAGTFYSAFVFPVFGRMMDRRTIRAVALPAIVAYGILLAAVGLAPHSLWVFVILMGLAVVDAGSAPMPERWTGVILRPCAPCRLDVARKIGRPPRST
jgi:hypothetical protein